MGADRAWTKVAGIIASVSAVMFIISFTKLLGWFGFLCAGFSILVIFAMQKYDYVAVALPMIIYMSKEMIQYFITKLPYLGYYTDGSAVLGVIMMIADIGLIVIYILVISGPLKKKTWAAIYMLLVLGINSVGCIVIGLIYTEYISWAPYMFGYQMGQGLFMAAYFIIIMAQMIAYNIERKNNERYYMYQNNQSYPGSPIYQNQVNYRQNHMQQYTNNVLTQFVSTPPIQNTLDSNCWRCPSCQTVNPRYVSTCKCGFLYEDAQAIVKKLEDEQRKLKEKRDEEERIRKRKENEEWKRQQEELEKYRNLGLTDSQMSVVKMLQPKDTKLTSQIMCQKLSRSASLQDFRIAVENLEESHLIEKDEEGKYYLALRFDEDSKTEEIKAIDVDDEEDVVPPQTDLAADITTETIVEETDSFDKYEELRQMKALLDDGIITENEYEQKKKDILGL